MNANPFSKTDIETLTELEHSLWRSETRFNLAYQEKVFAADFFEFGRSGRTYTRDQMVQSGGHQIQAKLPLQELKVRAIDANNALVTYVSEVQYDEIEKANRCSVWSRTEEGWQLRFHQGTPTA